MAYITKQQYVNSQWLTWVNTNGFNCEILTTPHQMIEAEAIAWRDNYLAAHEYDNTPQITIDIYNQRETVRTAILWIRENNPTLTQWNGYLATLAWDEAYAVRWFLARLALEIASRKEISLSTYTETQVLAQLKTWIINTPPKRLSKILFGE